MPLLPRPVLKSFFQLGDKPTASQFAAFIDSAVIYADDYSLLGLTTFNQARIYVAGDSVIYNQIIYQANTTTTVNLPFNILQWNKIAGSTPGSVNFKGPWNASTNTPNLNTIGPALGDYYIVSVAGNTPLNSPPNVISNWNVGDWAIYDGTLWGKVDNTDAVTDGGNVGAGAEVFKGKNNTILEFNSLTSNIGSINIVEGINEIDLSIQFDDAGSSPSRALSASEIDNRLSTKEPAITGTGNIADFWSGAKTFRNLANDVRAVTLTGLSLVTNQVISATDTIVQALGYLQKQVSDNLATLTGHISNISNPHSVTKSQVGLGNVQNTKVNLVAITDPTSVNDSTQGYSIGSFWVNTIQKSDFVCVDAAVGAAVWKERTIDYSRAVYSSAVSTSSMSFQPNPSNPPVVGQVLSTLSRSGAYRIQWSAIVSNDKKQGEFRLVDYTTPAAPVQVGKSIFYEAAIITDQISVGSIAVVNLTGTNKDYLVQFRAVGSGSTEILQESQIEIFRLS